MVLYTSESLIALGGISAEQMETNIIESTARTNEAFANSNVALFFRAVHIGLVREFRKYLSCPRTFVLVFSLQAFSQDRR